MEEAAIREKIKVFQELIAQKRWNDLVTTCYAPDATLSHFMEAEPLQGREYILQFFEKTPSGYQLDLRYTATPLESEDAWLIAGIGSVDKGPWCCFVERWERSEEGEWLIQNDKVYIPEDWMK